MNQCKILRLPENQSKKIKQQRDRNNKSFNHPSGISNWPHEARLHSFNKIHVIESDT